MQSTVQSFKERQVCMTIIIVCLLWLLCGFLCGAIAVDKGRDRWRWFLIGVLFGPLAVLLIARVSGAGENAVESRQEPKTTADEEEAAQERESPVSKEPDSERPTVETPEFVRVTCEHCHARYRLKPPATVKKYRCKRCNAPIIVYPKTGEEELDLNL